MKGLLSIAGKELRIYFSSPMAYVVIAVFLLINGHLYRSIVLFAIQQGTLMMQLQGALPEININQMIFRPVFHNMAIIMILTLPLLTMRLFAEEKKIKTIELLMTSPLSITAILLGKYLAALLILIVILLLTAFMPLLLDFYGDLKWEPVLTGYLGLFLLGSVFLAFGLLASSLTENQVIAGFVGFGLNLLLWLMSWASQGIQDTPLASLFSYISIGEHFDNFVKGLIDTADIVYLLSLVVLGLFVTHRILESQRWK